MQSIVPIFSAQTLSLIIPDITLFYVEGKKPLSISYQDHNI